jgi:hypothetical protein
MTFLSAVELPTEKYHSQQNSKTSCAFEESQPRANRRNGLKGSMASEKKVTEVEGSSATI